MSDPADILIVDDEDLICFVLTQLLRVHGFAVRKASRGEEALEMIRSHPPSLVILDIRMPGMNGFDVLHLIRSMYPELPVILMTALSSVRDAVEGIKAGAFDYVGKPFDNNEMIDTVRRALARAGASSETDTKAEEELQLHPAFGDPEAASVMYHCACTAQRLALEDTPCLIAGELGTGKRRMARTMHDVSGREGPLLVLDCTGASESVLRSELYGGGSATGPARRGLLELFRHGTLVLDEITEIPAGLQDSLSMEYSRGFYLHPSTGASIHISGALIATSTAANEEDVMEKLSPGFMDLTRNRVLRMPSLRERKDDIPALVEEFISTASSEFGKVMQGITTEALAVLQKDGWPGNVHQLKSTVRRAVLTAGDRIEVSDVQVPALRDVLVFDDYPQITVTRSPLKNQVRQHIAEIERQLISDTLQKTRGNKAKASRLLGITYKTMLKKVAEYQLERGKRKG